MNTMLRWSIPHVILRVLIDSDNITWHQVHTQQHFSPSLIFCNNDSDNDHYKVIMMTHLDCPQLTRLRASGLGEEHVVAWAESVGDQDGGVHSPDHIWGFGKTESSLDFWPLGMKILFTWDIHHEFLVPFSNNLKRMFVDMFSLNTVTRK